MTSETVYFIPANNMSRVPAANRKRVSKMHVIPGRKEEDQTYIVIVLQVTSTDLGMRAN